MNMGKKMKLIRFAICAAFGLMLAAPAAHATNTVTMPITSIIVNASSLSGGTAWIYSSVAWINPAGCTKFDRAMIDPSEANYNLMMTMIYDAYANGDTIAFNINSAACVTIGAQTYPRITEIILTKS